MRIPRLPDSVRSLPNPQKRVNALQSIVNQALHARNICPRGQYNAGPTTFRVGVYLRGSTYVVESNFSNYDRRTGESTSETYLENIALEAIANVR